ncbi:uncharacterized protein [Haliotis cracherodii]|uniref:uncharacterized protein n=1 Tax=Haliotis cracherodii TaxID=6455 RepID=UPI0039E8A753
MAERALTMTRVQEGLQQQPFRENITRVHDIVMADQRLTTQHIASVVGISHERVEHIITNELGMTKVTMALEGGWKTTVIRPINKILSVTWSPSSVKEFYALTNNWSHYMVKMFMIKGDKLKNANPWHLMPLPLLNIEWSTIDTGMCMANADLSCIYTFGKVKHGSTYAMYLRSYREAKNPRKLVLEREKEITKNIPATVLSCIFACNRKFGMGVYLRQGDSAAVQKYRIDVGEGALVLDGRMDVKGLVQMPQNIKWNIDGTVAFALCEKTFYIIIRCCNDKEQVDIEVKNKWIGWYALYWTNTSIVVYDAQNGGRLAVFLSFKFT